MNNHSRRQFMQVAGAGAFAAATCDAAGRLVRKGMLVDPGKKLRIACVGCGNKGAHDVDAVSGEDIVALCDVDAVTAKKTFDAFPDVPKYKDFRIMLEEMDDRIDAVTVVTPDHMHYAVAMAAIERGKHVFVQKPMAFTLWETRRLTEAARKHDVVSGMGNQGHAMEGLRLVREWIQAGVIGDVTEVHCWTNKLFDGDYRSKLRGELPPKEQVPEHLDWNLWLGTAPKRGYSQEYVPKKWRGWWEIGNGALGDIGCHTMDAPFYALDLGAPIAVTAETSGYNEITYPDWSIITYEFPARGAMPPVKLVWYDGGKLPPRPADLEQEREFKKQRGQYYVGSKGTIYDATERCQSPRIIPEAKRRALRDSMPPATIPRVPEGNCHTEWIAACKGGPKAGSNFDYSGPLSEVVLLGNLAIRANGRRVEWNPEKMETNIPGLNKYINTPRRKF